MKTCNFLFIKFLFSSQGLWRFEITFQKSFESLPDERLDIWAESANSSQIQLRTWNSALDNQPLDFTKAPVGLYAQLTQDNKPIRGANVTAFVYVSDSTGSTSSLLAEIPLMDEGISGLTKKFRQLDCQIIYTNYIIRCDIR